MTPKSIPFAEGFKKKFGNYPSYAGYTSYDEVYYIADAVKRGGSTDADKLVDALEKTDWEGTIGRIQFYGRQDEFTHSIKYGKGLITGLMLQWQDGNLRAGHALLLLHLVYGDDLVAQPRRGLVQLRRRGLLHAPRQFGLQLVRLSTQEELHVGPPACVPLVWSAPPRKAPGSA